MHGAIILAIHTRIVCNSMHRPVLLNTHAASWAQTVEALPLMLVSIADQPFPGRHWRRFIDMLCLTTSVALELGLVGWLEGPGRASGAQFACNIRSLVRQ